MLNYNFTLIPNIGFNSIFIRFILKFFVAESFLLDWNFFKDLKNKPIFWCWFPNKNFLNDRKNKMGRRTYKNLNGKNNEFKRIGVLKNRSRLLCPFQFIFGIKWVVLQILYTNFYLYWTTKPECRCHKLLLSPFLYFSFFFLK